jgi:uncharacterized protein RhaS with RHS repeats
MKARYCSPSLGRFHSVDPVEGRSAAANSWNRYSYVRNDPVAFVDPNGEDRFAILVGDSGKNHWNVGHNFTRAAMTREAEMEAKGHAVSVTRISTAQDLNAAIRAGDTIDGGVVLYAHGGVIQHEREGITQPAIFIGENEGQNTNLTAANVGELSSENLGQDATIELVACNSAGVAQAVANALDRDTTATVGGMSFSPKPDEPMNAAPGTLPPDTGPLYLVPNVGGYRITVEPEDPEPSKSGMRRDPGGYL